VPPASCKIGRDEAAARLEIGNHRHARVDAIEVVEAERVPPPRGRWRPGAARRWSIRRWRRRGDGVLERLARDDQRGTAAGAQHVHHQPPGRARDVGLARIGRRHVAAADRGEAEELAGGGHGVGGELAAAGAAAGQARSSSAHSAASVIRPAACVPIAS
jgi:hypothetical protein